jgi:hypothetical protein
MKDLAPRGLLKRMAMHFKNETLVLERLNGLEEYPITKSSYNCVETTYAYKDDLVERYVLTFQFNCDRSPRPLPDTAVITARPSIEINFYTNSETAQFPRAGDEYAIAEGYDPDIGMLTNLYFGDHQQIDRCEIRVVRGELKKALLVEITGTTTDDDGASKPATLWIRAHVPLDPNAGVTFS